MKKNELIYRAKSFHLKNPALLIYRVFLGIRKQIIKLSDFHWNSFICFLVLLYIFQVFYLNYYEQLS